MSFASRKAELEAAWKVAEESVEFHTAALKEANTRKREAGCAVSDLTAWQAVSPAVRQKLLGLTPEQLLFFANAENKARQAAEWPEQQGLIRVVARRSGGRFNMLTGYDVSLTKAGDAAVALARRGADWFGGK